MNGTIAWMTARGLFGRRRFLLLLPLPLLMVGLAVLARTEGAAPEEWGQVVIVALGFLVVLPVVSLIVGTGVLGSEIDDGTLTHILTKPLPRYEVILSKLVVAVSVTAVTVAIPMYVCGVMADSVQFGLALAAVSAVGAAAYTALFLALSLATRRPVLLGLVYLLIWEGLLGNMVSGTKVLSIQQYVIALADRITPTQILEGAVSVPVAAVMSALFLVGGTALAVAKLRTFSVAGETS